MPGTKEAAKELHATRARAPGQDKATRRDCYGGTVAQGSFVRLRAGLGDPERGRNTVADIEPENEDPGEYSENELAFMGAHKLPEEAFDSLHRLCYDAVESYGTETVKAVVEFVADEFEA